MSKVKGGLFVLFIPASVIFSLFSGSIAISPAQFFTQLFNGGGEAVRVIVQFRLPVVVQAFLCGGILAVAGAALQAVLRNPLAEPFMLGVSSGCALGLVLASALGFFQIFWLRTAFSFVVGLLAVFIVFAGAFRFKLGLSLTGIILSGVIVNAFFSAAIMFVQSLLVPFEFKSSIGFLMGNFTVLSWAEIIPIYSIAMVAVFILFFLSPEMDLFSLGREQAVSLGVDTGKVLLLILITASMITAVTVSLSGVIGFVGLIAPHAVRFVRGGRHRGLLPLSFLAGGSFLVFAEGLSRSLISMWPIPVGAVTAVIGAPIFLIVLWKYGRRHA